MVSECLLIFGWLQHSVQSMFTCLQHVPGLLKHRR